MRAHTGLKPSYGFALGGRPLLRKGFLVEVQDDHIVVRVTGTSYAASYYRIANSPDFSPDTCL